MVMVHKVPGNLSPLYLIGFAVGLGRDSTRTVIKNKVKVSSHARLLGVQLNDVTVGERVVAVDHLAFEFAMAPDARVL